MLPSRIARTAGPVAWIGLAACVLLAALGVCLPVQAQQTSSSTATSSGAALSTNLEIEDALRRGMQLEHSGEWSEALAHYEDAVKHFPERADLQQRLGLAILLITHDLGVIAEAASRVLVMYGGQIVEESPVRELFANPRHPYTQGLLAAMPRLGQSRERLLVIPGTVPPPTAWPSGCRFRDRCPYAWDRCAAEAPPLYPVRADHGARCPPAA